jgi:dipeptide transport system permease protein
VRISVYIARRLLLMVPVLFGLSIFIFSLTRIGGDPAYAYVTEGMSAAQIDAIRETYHLNEPLHVQYVYWLNGVVHGDWGVSPTNGYLPVTDSIAMFFPATLELALFAIVIAVAVSVVMGTRSAVKKDRAFDHATRLATLASISVPIFVLALGLQYVFYYQLHLLPATGRYDEFLFMMHSSGYHEYTGLRLVDALLNGDAELFWDALKHIILPATALGLGTAAALTRIMRVSMLEVLSLDYIRTARAKGLEEGAVVRDHARRNALIPTVTMSGMLFASLLGGAVLTEWIFAWPGLGYWSASAIAGSDSVSVVGFVMFFAIVFVIVNLAVDILYAFLDPRMELR